MQIRALAVLVLAVMLAEGLLVPPAVPKSRAPPPYTALAPGWKNFPPAPVAQPGVPASASENVPRMEDEIRRLGMQPPRYTSAARQAFVESPDLYQFVLSQLDAARRGEGESQYLISLALDQCRLFLRLSPTTALELNERMLGSSSTLEPDERMRWEADYQRCLGFANHDWSVVGDALGSDRPGAETEQFLVWSERAALAGYPMALADQALRPKLPSLDQRRRQLETAVASGDPGVYWLLFVHHANATAGTAAVPARAWLLLACRRGLDCRRQARWYRELRCLGIERGCESPESALQHYWSDLTPQEREQAYRLAAEIERGLRSGGVERLPLPPDVFANPAPEETGLRR